MCSIKLNGGEGYSDVIKHDREQEEVGRGVQ